MGILVVNLLVILSPGAEDKIMLEQKAMHDELNLLQAMIQSSGKLVLIDKLLPRLKQGGHKVLYFYYEFVLDCLRLVNELVWFNKSFVLFTY